VEGLKIEVGVTTEVGGSAPRAPLTLTTGIMEYAVNEYSTECNRVFMFKMSVPT